MKIDVQKSAHIKQNPD